MTAEAPSTPYYAVIFSSKQRSDGTQEYGAMAEKMEQLASQQPGYLGIESARSRDGQGITISYWRDLDSIAAWKVDSEHQAAQRRGRAEWYQQYHVRIVRIESEYAWEAD